jgi:hypothetical protein
VAARFCKIKPSFWHIKKTIHMDSRSKLLAIYLMTSPSFQMVGIYHIPKVTMQAHTGLSADEIDQCIDFLETIDFMRYDSDQQVVWVVDMAATQVADNPNPKQLKGVRNELARLWEEESPFVEEWLERHRRYGLSINSLEVPYREADENN